MSKRRSSEAFYHAPRDTVEADGRSRKWHKKRGRMLDSSVPHHFVPSFSVRRRVLVTDEVKEFSRDLKEALPRNYRILPASVWGLTIVEQGRMIDRFRRAEVQPEPEHMERVAQRTARELKQSLQGVPRRLDVPLGNAEAFGDRGNRTKIGIIPRGWRGFSAHYAERGVDKSVLPIPILVRETNLCVGGLMTAFGHREELSQGIPLDSFTMTPHISIAKKERGGPISASEMHAMAGVIQEIMPDSLALFDPTISLRLERGQEDPVFMQPRSPRLSQNARYLSGV